MHRMTGRAAFFDGQIIDADKDNAAIDKQLSGRGSYVSKVRSKATLRLGPERGVLRFEYDTLHAADIAHVFRFDRNNVNGHLDHAARPDKLLRIEFVNAVRAVDKMIWRIDVRARVNTKCDLRYICRRPRQDGFKITYLNTRIALVDRCRFADRDRNIKYLHGIRIMDTPRRRNALRSLRLCVKLSLVNFPRISASSYSNTAPLVWSFLYGSNHGKVEIILDNAPSRSAELLSQNRVDAALVPAIAYQTINDGRLIPDVCVGAREKVRSVCLITKGTDLKDVRSVSLDASSLTSVVLTKIIFREFLGFEPEWREGEPNIHNMLSNADCALLIGDPALRLSDSAFTTFDLAELWHQYTGLGFIFAMWMTRRDNIAIDFAAARDEGVAHLDEIIANYQNDISLGREELKEYLSRNISYSIDDSMQRGMELFFELAEKNGFITENRPLVYT